MIVKKFKSGTATNLPINDYRIDWERAVSKPQKLVKDFLYPYWRGHVVLEEMIIPGSLLRIDLFNVNKHIAVEVSPAATHRRYSPHFHRKNVSNFLASIKRDDDKRKWCEQNEFTLVEIYDEDLLNLSTTWFFQKYKIVL